MTGDRTSLVPGGIIVIVAIAALGFLGREADSVPPATMEPPPARIVAPQPAASLPASTRTANRAAVTFTPSRVSFDYGARTMTIRGRIRRAAGAAPSPDTVWVWAYFVNPQVTTEGSWSDAPIPVIQPLASRNTATIEARGSAHWLSNPDLPRTGYYARVSWSASSAESATVPSSARDYSTRSMVPVSVVTR